MPIYEFACPDCRKIFNFLSKKLQPEHVPACPKCGGRKMTKQISSFAMPRGAKEPSASTDAGPEMDDPRMMRAMSEMEREMEYLDENNPRHMAHLMRKMKEMMPADSMPKEFETAIKRLEAGEDPEKIEEDMGDILGGMDEGEGAGGGAGGYSHDSGLYDY
jgi:putative FmdB family regulatory protein